MTTHFWRQVLPALSGAAALLLGWLLVPGGSPLLAQTTTPILVANHVRADVDQARCLARADEALSASGLTKTGPTSLSREGSDRFLTAVIRCFAVEQTTIIDVSVAGFPGHRADAERLRNCLTEYMATGSSSCWSAGSGSGTCEAALQEGRTLQGEYRHFLKGARNGAGSTQLQARWDQKTQSLSFRWGTADAVTVRRIPGQDRLDFVGTQSGRPAWLATMSIEPAQIRIEYRHSDGGYDTGEAVFPCAQSAVRNPAGRRAPPAGSMQAGSTPAQRLPLAPTPAPASPRGPGPAGGAGVCVDPRAIATMDQWLREALPPQQPGESLRYEQWGRLIGSSTSAVLRVAGPPDTRLSRCEYLWQNAERMRSTNLGTLGDYIRTRIR